MGGEGGLWGSRKICNCFFLRRQPAASSTVKLITLLPRPRRGFAGGSQAPEKCNRLQERKKGQELGQADRQVGKQAKNKKKNNLHPSISGCRLVLFFFPLIFLVDFNILLSSRQSLAHFPLPGERRTACVSSCLQADPLQYISHICIYIYIYMSI